MLRFEGVFWATQNQNELKEKLTRLGFKVGPSEREPQAESIYFGPEAIELFGTDAKLSTLGAHEGEGIIGLGLESDHLSADYSRLHRTAKNLEAPQLAKDAKGNIPLWTGFALPKEMTSPLKTWVMMNSPEVLKQQTLAVLPTIHPNTCFGIEGIHVLSSSLESVAQNFSSLLEKHASGIEWNEIGKTSGKRIQAGDRFFDVLSENPKLGSQSVFMLTLRIEDLERARKIAQEAGANPVPCATRDGFIVPSSFTGGPALRFVRASWKRYLPVVNENYPLGRRTDFFRPLGGANSSTLRDGFGDNWKY